MEIIDKKPGKDTIFDSIDFVTIDTELEHDFADFWRLFCEIFLTDLYLKFVSHLRSMNSKNFNF